MIPTVFLLTEKATVLLRTAAIIENFKATLPNRHFEVSANR